jgi:hypothetical protein
LWYPYERWTVLMFEEDDWDEDFEDEEEEE